MKLADIFDEDNIIAELTASDKEGVIRSLVEQLWSSGVLDRKQVASLVRALMRREELGSTGIGKGFAVPHAKHTGVNGAVGVLARVSQGVEFDALDGQKVNLIFLLVSSPDAVEPHIETLRRVTTIFKDEELCSFLRRAKDREELAELLREADERLAE